MTANRMKAFTLIELLVVIAIIALLVGILLPALGSARTLARKVRCGVQMSQIMTALHMYADDNDDFHHARRQNAGRRFFVRNGSAFLTQFHTSSPWGFSGADDTYWGAIYSPYLGYEPKADDFRLVAGRGGYGTNLPVPGWEQFGCPDATDMDPFPGGTAFDPDHLYSTYGFNGVYRERGTTFFRPERPGGELAFTGSPATRLTTINFPSRIITFQDAYEHMLDANGDTLNDLSQYDNPDVARGQQNWEREYFRHGNECQTVWLDAHVESIAKVTENTSLPLYSGLFE